MGTATVVTARRQHAWSSGQRVVRALASHIKQSYHFRLIIFGESGNELSNPYLGNMRVFPQFSKWRRLEAAEW